MKLLNINKEKFTKIENNCKKNTKLCIFYRILDYVVSY